MLELAVDNLILCEVRNTITATSSATAILLAHLSFIGFTTDETAVSPDNRRDGYNTWSGESTLFDCNLLQHLLL